MTHFDDILAALRAAGEPTRLRTLLLLAEGELTVSELTQILDQSQPRVSRHLKVLAEAGLVEKYQESAWTFYRLSDARLLERLGIGAEGEALGVALPAAERQALDRLKEERIKAAETYFAQHAEDWEHLRALHIDDATIEARLVALAGEGIETFLDLGTGTGRMLIVFSQHYKRGIGLDLSAEMLSVARAQLGEALVPNAHVRRADFMTAPMPEAADVICIHHVLHFLPSPEKALAKAAKALTATGRILIADFAPHDHEELREQYAHRRLGFSEAEMASWAAKAGLSVTACEEFAPPVKGGLTSCIWRLDPLASHPSTNKITPERQHVPA